MLVFSTTLQRLLDHPSRHGDPSLTLALAPHLITLLAVLHSVVWLGWVHYRAARQLRREATLPENGGAPRDRRNDESAPLLSSPNPRGGTDEGPPEPLRASGWELVLEGMKVVVAVALFGLSLAKLTGYDGGKWDRVLEGGIVALTVRLPILLSARREVLTKSRGANRGT
jgi:hypothetical protein